MLAEALMVPNAETILEDKGGLADAFIVISVAEFRDRVQGRGPDGRDFAPLRDAAH